MHYYELDNHKERITKLNKYTNEHNFASNNFNEFENNKIFPDISLSVYDNFGKMINDSNNDAVIKAYIVKINENRCHALKSLNKYIELNNLLNQFTHKELTDFILNKIIS